MANIRCRKETGKLYFDFMYKGVRCREQTALTDTPANNRKLMKVRDKIKAEIMLDLFDYSSYFPNSHMLKKLDVKARIIQQHLSGTPSFSGFVKQWFEEVSVTWSKSYTVTVQSIIDKRLNPYFKDVDVGQIKKADLMLFRAQLAKVKSKTGNRFSADYINRHMKILRMILNEAADRYEFTTPYRNIKPLKKERKDIEPFSLEEVELIIGNVRDDFTNYYITRFFTGMRTGEIHGLKWRYIDFDKRLILIRECWLKGEETYTKTDGSQRDIQMSQRVFDALKDQYEVTKNCDYVFSTQC
jgi:integrase